MIISDRQVPGPVSRRETAKALKVEKAARARADFIYAAPWWCSPAGIAIGFLLPMFILTSFAVQLNLQGLTARGIHFLTLPYLLLGVGIIFVMAAGGWIGAQISIVSVRPATSADAERAALMIGSLALIAYVIWFRGYLINPAALWAILTGAYQPQRTDELVAGLTSLANGGPVFFAIYSWRRVFRPDEPMRRGMNWMCTALGLLTAFRVYAWSERLALIEAVLPVALIYSVKATQSKWMPMRLIVRFGPFIALPLLMLYFGLAESVRSWTSDTYNGKIDFWDFVVGRMATYYYTSLNNGAGLLATQPWPTYKFDYSLSMLHTAPLIGSTFSTLVGSTGQTFGVFLYLYGDLEFNNPSGFYTVVFDMGIPLAIAYFAVTGFIAGVLFRRFEKGSLTAAMFFPMFFISYLEVFRYPYLGSGRAFAWGVCALIALLLVHHGRFHRGHGDWKFALTRID